MTYQQIDEPESSDDNNIVKLTRFSSFGNQRASSSEGGSFSPTPKTRELKIERHGITWILDLVPHGTFANGDPWVIGPVRLRQILPGSQEIDGRRVNGSMINPSPEHGLIQGYDEGMYGPYKGPGANYSPELDVGFQVIREGSIILQPGQSLVSVESFDTVTRPQLLHGAVLTCLADIPPELSFRPGYSDGEKSIQFNEADIQSSVLGAQGGLVDGTIGSTVEMPSLTYFERRMEGLWIDHIPEWIVRYAHPAANMPDYSRAQTDQYGGATLFCNVNNFTFDQKKRLIVHCIQKGIDSYSCIESPGGINVARTIVGQTIKESPWVPGDGQGNGRFWRILFAGMMLDDAIMKGIGSKSTSTSFPEDFDILFQGENGQTFHVAATPDGKINWGFGGYTSGDIGLAEWGPKHSTRPDKDVKSLAAGSHYRTCCTASSWWGQALACLKMNGSADWNHAPFFDYLDRYDSTIVPSLGGAGTLVEHFSAWPKKMWDAYRGGLT